MSVRATVTAGLVAVVVMALPSPAQAQPPAGVLDPSFGAGGFVTRGFAGGGFDGAVSALPLPHGGVVVAGSANEYPGRIDFALAGYRANGSPDPSFGTGGAVVTMLPEATSEDTHAAVRQRDGRLILAGVSGWNPATGTDFLLARYLPDGSLDPSFGGGDGLVKTDLGANEVIRAVALQSDGRIVVTGEENGYPGPTHFAVGRYLSDGTPDPGFGGGDGFVITAFGAKDEPRAVAVQPDGRIVVGGRTVFANGYGDFALARYLSDGSLDPSFGAGGLVTSGLPDGYREEINALIVHAGKIVVTGQRISGGPLEGLVTARYRADGTLDPTFGDGGWAIGTIGFDGGVAVVARGSQLIVGGFNWQIVRYDHRGRELGKLPAPAAGQLPSLYGLALDRVGRLYAVGATDRDNVSDMLTARYRLR